MFAEPRETSVITVNLLNMKEFSKSVMLYLIGNGFDMQGSNYLAPHSPLGIATGKNGKHYLIDTEGCGSGVALEDAPEKVSWYRETLDKDGEPTSFDMFPCVKVTFSKEELDAVPVTGTQTLDKFVRVSGGSRLERNFGAWEKFLITGIEPKY